MERIPMVSPTSGVVFMITNLDGQYRIHVHAIPEDEERSTYVLTYSACIKKYNKFIHCNEFYERFEAMSEDEQELYVARYLRGEGIQKLKVRRDESYVIKRVVSKILYVRRDNRGFRRFDSYQNKKQLDRAIKRFHRNGYDVYTEDGMIRYYKIRTSDLKDAADNLFIQDANESYGTMRVDKTRKSMQAKFWNNK